MTTTRIFMGKTVTIRGPKLHNGLNVYSAYVDHRELFHEKPIRSRIEAFEIAKQQIAKGVFA